MASHHEWSPRSWVKLKTCDPLLQELCNEVLSLFPHDIIIIEGHRSNERQDELFRTGMSKLKGGQSKHNSQPSKAVDMAPLLDGKIQWDNKELWMQFSGFVRGVGERMDIPVISGVDWNNNYYSHDHTFFDGPHFELIS